MTAKSTSTVLRGSHPYVKEMLNECCSLVKQSALLYSQAGFEQLPDLKEHKL